MKKGPTVPHHWLPIVLGRVCSKCHTAQAHDEFEEVSQCREDKVSEAEATTVTRGNRHLEGANKSTTDR